MTYSEASEGLTPDNRLRPEAKQAINAYLRFRVLAPLVGALGLLSIAAWLAVTNFVAVSVTEHLRGESLAQLAAETRSQLRGDNEFVQRVSTDVSRIMLPVGSVIPILVGYSDAELYRSLPRNWVLCDGKVLDSSHPRGLTEQDVHPSLWGRATPDFQGRYLRGASEAIQAGQAGGDANFPAITLAPGGRHKHTIMEGGLHRHTLPVSGAHAHDVPAHAHGLPATTGSVTHGGGNPNGHPYSVRDDHAGWTDGHHLSVDGGSSRNEGQHRHDLGGNTAPGGATRINGGAHSHEIDQGGLHTHDMSESEAHVHEVAAVSYFPAFIACRFIMRVN